VQSDGGKGVASARFLRRSWKTIKKSLPAATAGPSFPRRYLLLRRSQPATWSWWQKKLFSSRSPWTTTALCSVDDITDEKGSIARVIQV